MIIGLVGFIGSGKDTVADYLVSSYGFRRESFAGVLKDIVSVVFGWDREMLEGKTSQSRSIREQVDPWWAQRLDIPHLTPRWVLQQWGTEVLRKNFHDEIWVAALENKLRHTHGDIVISDCRFPNEIKSLRANDAQLFWVERGERPVWYDWAVRYNTCQDAQFKTTMRIIAELEQSPIKYKIHESEWAWVGQNFDRILANDGSIQDLYQQVDSIAQKSGTRSAGFQASLDLKISC